MSSFRQDVEANVPALRRYARALTRDTELADAVSTATGVRATFVHERITDDYDCRYLRLDNGGEAAVVVQPADRLDEAIDEIDNAKEIGGWTFGTNGDEGASDVPVAAGTTLGVVLVVRVSGVGSPMAALKVARAVAGLLNDDRPGS